MNGPQKGARSTSIRYFGDYVLLGEIASGGMGVVFNARQVTLNRKVAVKLIRGGQMAGETELRRFRTEAEAAARLDHPHIVPIYEIGEHEGQPFIAMKLIEGDSLAERLSNENVAVSRPDLALEQAAALVAKIARAVQHAHEHGVLHRDIKPGNILLDAGNEPHLTDFGLAKLLERDSSHTLSAAILGTPHYMAPEQAAGNMRAITSACDIYSLGAVLYALITGRPPFHGPSAAETMQRVKDQKPQRPQAINPLVDADLEFICLKCLEKEPGRRYATARALAEDLERWLRREPLLTRPLSPWIQLGRWSRNRPRKVALAAVSIVALLGLLVTLTAPWFKSRGKPEQPARASADSNRAELQARQVQWHTISVAAVQAEPNCGYRIETPMQVTLTLPSKPNPGDLVRLVGPAAGGWRFLQNSNQVILTDNLDAGKPGLFWIPRANNRQWHDVAMSADGTKLLVADFGYRERGGKLYTSSDGGTSWTQGENKRLWTSVAMSVDGSRLVAAAFLSRVYVSTDFGASWTPHGIRQNWTDLASSADGQRLVALDAGTNTTGGQIYTSDDGGLSWTARESNRNWCSVASSADGSRLLAAVGEANIKGHAVLGYLYGSSDYGVTWTRLTDEIRRWLRVASSADGNKLIAVEDNNTVEPGGRIYVSADAGASWQARGPTAIWRGAACSPDGSSLLALGNSPSLQKCQAHLSTDFGLTWNTQDVVGFLADAVWSADGRKLVSIAGSFEGPENKDNNVYTSVAATLPGPAGAFTADSGSEIDLQYVGYGQFRILRATGDFTIEGKKVRAPLPR